MRALTKAEAEEATALIASEDLGFPDFRKVVSHSGANVAWVRKALHLSGKGSPRLRELMGL